MLQFDDCSLVGNSLFPPPKLPKMHTQSDIGQIPESGKEQFMINFSDQISPNMGCYPGGQNILIQRCHQNHVPMPHTGIQPAIGGGSVVAALIWSRS